MKIYTNVGKVDYLILLKSAGKIINSISIYYLYCIQALFWRLELLWIIQNSCLHRVYILLIFNNYRNKILSNKIARQNFNFERGPRKQLSFQADGVKVSFLGIR